ncbi:MAG: OsmC family protein [Gemmatimonadetes bacterium]|nr:OsmC family protein [Gemmatimonadota bacterium]
MTEPTLPGPTTTVTATWQADQRFEVRGTTGAPIIIDADKKAGTGPVDTLLGALAACSAVDVLEYLEKRRTPAEQFEIVVTAERRAKTARRVVSAQLEYRINGAGIEAPHAERAIELAIEKYCSVGSSLASDIALTSMLVLNGQAHAPTVRHIEDALL